MALKELLLAYIRLVGVGVILVGALMGLSGYVIAGIGLAVIGIGMSGIGPALVAGYREGRESTPSTD